MRLIDADALREQLDISCRVIAEEGLDVGSIKVAILCLDAVPTVSCETCRYWKRSCVHWQFCHGCTSWEPKL